MNTRGNWENSKLCGNTPPFGRRVSTQFLVFPISTRVDITIYQHGKCFIFVKYVMFSCLHFILYPVQNDNVININPSCHMTHVTCHMTNATSLPFSTYSKPINVK
jgi:hypothetical protein